MIGDVTDKGVPAALVMATTRSILRAAAERLASPGEVLARVNELLCPDIPPKMFVTCLYAVLDPQPGCCAMPTPATTCPTCAPRRRGVNELRATGMPLGLMPGMHYEEKEIALQPGDTAALLQRWPGGGAQPAGARCLASRGCATLVGEHRAAPT